MDPKASDDAKHKAEQQLTKVSINCLVCHQRNAITHKWVDGFPQKNEVYGSKEGSHADQAHPVMKKSPIMSESILCGQCHGLGPNFELENPSQCGTLYGSYLWAYRAEGGQESCQECHMKKVNGKADHLIGPNFDDKAEAGDFLSKNIHLDVETLGYQWLRKAGDLRPMVVVNTKVTQDAGHRIPDG